MRIIAGSAKGRPLKVPKSGSVRPTADRVKETLFNVLGQWLDGERVLDLFAGVGALGLEALSRGAGHATFVERDAATMAVLRDNARTLGFDGQARTLQKNVARALGQLAGEGARFELVFADPPYAAQETNGLVEEIEAAGVLAAGGRLVIEHDRRMALPPSSADGLVRFDERRFGDTLLSFYRREEPPLGVSREGIAFVQDG